MLDLLRERGAGHIKVFGGGGGVDRGNGDQELHDYGVTRIFSPEDGQKLGLQGMINEIVAAADADLAHAVPASLARYRQTGDRFARTRALARAHQRRSKSARRRAAARRPARGRAKGRRYPALGITGTGGAGKSSLTDELVRRFRLDQHDALKIAIISIDPSRRKSGGALLGDRIRMNAIEHPNIYMRSLATRDAGSRSLRSLPDVIAACRAAGFDLVIVETSGIGQGDAAIVPLVDTSLYVMTPGIRRRVASWRRSTCSTSPTSSPSTSSTARARRTRCATLRKQYQRNRELFKQAARHVPVYGTMASRFNDDGVTALLPGACREADAARTQAVRPARCRQSRPTPVDGAARHPACPRAFATSPKSPRRCAGITPRGRKGDAHRARTAATARRQGDARGRIKAEVAELDTLDRRARPRSRIRARRSCSTCGRRPRRPTRATSTS